MKIFSIFFNDLFLDLNVVNAKGFFFHLFFKIIQFTEPTPRKAKTTSKKKFDEKGAATNQWLLLKNFFLNLFSIYY